MSVQLFKNNVPNDLVFQLLNSLCLKNEKYYLFNTISFKKGIFNEEVKLFFELCKPYYHISKRKKYLEISKITYNNFTTVLRQICNCNKIIYTSQIKYDKSVYDIVYFIYF
jgi:hypothetical protein